MHGPEEMVSVDFGLPPGANRVGGAGRLDLDDLGTHIAEQSRGEWTGDECADFQHPDTVEGAGCGHLVALEKPCRPSQSVITPTASFSVSR